ncbi:MAG: type VI secretion system tube protein Hcp [Pseudomonadota bacterium]
MPIYMKMDGVNGAVTASGYEKQVALDGLSFGCSRVVSMRVGDSGNRSENLPDFNEVMCTKSTDESSFGILKEAVSGRSGKTVEIAVVEAGEKPTEYVKYTLKDVIVSHYDMSSSGDQPVESFQLSYTDVEVKFTPTDKSGAAGGPGIVGFDLATGKPR